MGLKIKTLEKNVRPTDYQEVRVKEMGNVIEIMYSDKKNHKIFIKKISDTEYIDLRTGEVKQCNKIDNRAGNLNSVRQSLSRLRDLLNTNITDVSRCRWITLTYAENMTNSKRLYEDFKNFNKRMRYALSKDGYKYEYIVCMEPQGRGAWHAHLVMIFEGQAPYIENKVMSSIWGHGFVKIKKLEDVDNVGAYLTAYLGDMDISDARNLSDDELNGLALGGGGKYADMIKSMVGIDVPGIGYAMGVDRLIAVMEQQDLFKDIDPVVDAVVIALDKESKKYGLDLAIKLRENGIVCEKTKVGDRYVLENMLQNGHIIGGEQYILSAVMHADERNRGLSNALGQDVYHYHLHVVYIPVVEKKVLRVPDEIVGIVKCANPKCITNHQPIPTKFSTAYENSELKLHCHYCEKNTSSDNMKIITEN